MLERREFLYAMSEGMPGQQFWSVKGMARWVCSVCDYEYDEEEGDPASGILPGTPFEDLPDDWRCSRCRVGKEAFVRVNELLEEVVDEEDYL
jgi:rubredoxin